MISPHNIKRWDIVDADLELVLYHTGKRIQQMNNDEANRYSKVHRDDQEKRDAQFPEETLEAQAGELVINQFMFGPIYGAQAYDHHRKKCNANPKFSDGKTDVLDYQIDMKTSYMRGSDNFYNYRLPVRPGDRNDGKGEIPVENVFALSLIRDGHMEPEKGFIYVHLIGWAWDHELPIAVDGYGIFEGAYTRGVSILNPMIDFPYQEAYWIQKQKELK